MSCSRTTHRREGGVRVRGLSKSYGQRLVLDGLDLDVEPGQVVALLGRSGSGKSTLIRILAGLDRPDASQQLEVGSVAVAFQEPRLLPWMPVWRNVALALEGAGAPRTRYGSRAAAVDMLGEVELADRAGDWPLALSGGQAQRVALARALVREPDVLLLDEPFSGLDALTRISMHQLVRRLHARHRRTMLLVTHDLDEAVRLADHVLVLAEGRITAAHPVGRQPDELRRELLGELGVTEDAIDLARAPLTGSTVRPRRPSGAGDGRS